jgi:hypothetical protein
MDNISGPASRRPPGRLTRAGDTQFLQNAIRTLKTDAIRTASADELAAIWNSPAEIRDAVFVHRTLCQIGFPREDPKQRRYERQYGVVSPNPVNFTRPLVSII